jgi:hypothetical protein
MARAAAIIGAAIATLAGCYVLSLAPVLNADRETIVSTPGLQGLNVLSLVPLAVGHKACTEPVYLTPEMGRIRYLVLGPQIRGNGVRVTLTGPGLKSHSTTIASANAGPDTQLTASFTPLARTSGLPATACIEPTKMPLTLVGTNEARSAVTAQTTVDGKPSKVDIALTLLRPSDQPVRTILGEIPARVSATTLGSVPTWVVSLLVVLACLTALLLPIAALVWADRIQSKQR